MTKYQLPQVQRIHTANGSHIEPPLNTQANDHEKLLWHAAVIALDTNLPINVAPGSYKIKRFGKWIDQGQHWSIQVGCTTTCLPFQAAWSYLNGIGTGARETQARKETK